MKQLLEKLNSAVNDVGGILSCKEAGRRQIQYRKLLGKAEIEWPPPDKPAVAKRGRTKQNVARRETY